MLQAVRRIMMRFPFDLDLPIFLYVAGHTVLQGVSNLRKTSSQNAVPVRVEYQEIPISALTPSQAKYLARWDDKLAILNYRPICTYRALISAQNLQRAYIAPGDKARCTVMVIELKTSGDIETVHHSCTARFVTDYANGQRLVTLNSDTQRLLDPCPNLIVQKLPHINDVGELKRRHDRRGAALGPAQWPPTDAKSIFELDEERRRKFDQHQLDQGLCTLAPGGDAFVLTDKAHWRAVRNHYNPFAQRFSMARLLPSIVIGAAVPLLSLLKLAPAVAGLAPIPGVAEATNTAAYLVAGAAIGYLLDRNLVWTFLITYVAAHAVLGWSFGFWPYSMLAALASFYSRRTKHRRRLILLKA
jgi:hypothetical protein